MNKRVWLLVPILMCLGALPLLAQPNVDLCSTPGSAIDSAATPTLDTITVIDSFAVADVHCLTQITHTFQGDLEIRLTSPGAVTVLMHDDEGGANDNIDITWNDQGVLYGSEPFDSGFDMEPSGTVGGAAQTMAEFAFVGATSDGVWELSVTDLFGGDTGTLDNWCVRTFDVIPPGPLLPPGAVTCTPGTVVGTMDVTWVNTSAYDSINIYVAGVLETTLLGTTTTYTTATPVAVPANLEVCVEGVVGGVPSNQACCNADLTLTEPNTLACSSVSGSLVIDATWVEPVIYDFVNIYVNGVLETSITGGTASYSTLPLAGSGTADLAIEGVITGVGTSIQVACTVALITSATVEECDVANVFVDDTLPPPQVTRVLAVVGSTTIADLEIQLEMTHTFQGDLEVDVASPLSTTVRLMDNQGGAADDVNAIFSDFGVPHNSVNLASGAFQQPFGPGTMGDFVGQDSAGNWTLTVADTFAADNGTLDSWCVRAFDTASNAFPVSDLACVSSVTTLGSLDATWTNNDVYTSIEVFVDGVLEATLPGTATSYTNLGTGVIPSTYTIAVEGIVSGLNSFQVDCTATAILAAPNALVCTTSAATLGVADLSWTNNGPYDQINIFANGVLEANLGAGSSSYTTLAQPLNTTVTYAVEGETFVPAGLSGQAACTVDYVIPAPTGALCSSTGGSGVVDVSWTNSFLYDQINVFVDGALEATLGGGVTSYTTLPIAVIPSAVTIDIQGELLTPAGVSANASCSATVLGAVDFEQCSNPGSAIDSALPPAVDIITPVGNGTLVGETQVSIAITHTFVGDLDITVVHEAVSVQLHAGTGGGADNMLVIYDDLGIANGAPYDAGSIMQPSGPGLLEDFIGTNLDGDWTMTVADTVGGDTGTLDEWCLRVNEGCPVVAPSGLTCVEDPAGVNLAWTNNGTYTDIDVERDGVVIASLPGSATSYSDATAAIGSVYTYRVRGSDSVEMCGNLSAPCTVSVAGVADLEVCNMPGLSILDNVTVSDVISVAGGPASLDDVQVSLDITHTWTGDLDVTVTFGAVSVQLMEDTLSGNFDDVLVTFSDGGVPYAAPFNGGLIMAPSGPGALADFDTLAADGMWTLDITDNAGGDTGSLNEWCLRLFGMGGGGLEDFIRGDSNGNNSVALNDAIVLLSFLFGGGAAPACPDAADANDNGSLALNDGIIVLSYLFNNGSPPAAPGPLACGPDVNADALDPCVYTCP